jgi:hypothetical protein
LAISERHTRAFATFTPFKSLGSRLWEWVALAFAPGNDTRARGPAFLHTAQICPVSPRQLARAGLASPRLKSGALLFMSTFNRDPETYFRGFNRELFPVMDAVWTHCEEWNGAREFPELLEFISKFERRSLVFFSAYPSRAETVRSGLELRRAIDELLNLAKSGGTDDEFRNEFARVAQRYWGNG